jgi:uncharacterized protein YegP (UPF0339 family)
MKQTKLKIIKKIEKSNGTIEIGLDKAKQYRWRAKANNGKIVATCGEGYTSKRACEHGIDVAEAIFTEFAWY